MRASILRMVRLMMLLSLVRCPLSVVGLPPPALSSALFDCPVFHGPAWLSASANNGPRTTDQGQEGYSRKWRMAFSVIWATCSSTGRLLTHEIEPTEKTPP